MSDNKTKIGHPDRDLFNKNEVYEVSHLVHKIANDYPKKTIAQVEKVVLQMNAIDNFHHQYKMVEQATRMKLDN